MSKRNIIVVLALIFVGISLRLINISRPLVDWQDWRQAYTGMISRNFYLNDYKLFKPQVDLDGPNPGYTACEFPIYQFMVALSYKIFHTEDLMGRLVSVIFSIGSMVFLFLLARQFYSFTVSIIALAFFVILPTNVFYSRAFMPESMMICCSLATLYFFCMWLKQDKKYGFFVLTIIFWTLAIAIKPFTLYLALPIFYLYWSKYGKKSPSMANLFGVKHFFRLEFLILIVLTLILPVYWYFFAHAHLKGELFGGLWDSGNRWGNFSWWFNPEFYSRIIFSRLAEMILTYSGFVFWILGMFRKVEDKKEYFFHFWVAGIFLYFLIIAQGNWEHDYYQLPLVPVACIFIGKYLSSFFKKYPVVGYKKPAFVLMIVLLVYVPVFSLIKIFFHLERPRSNDFYFAGRAVQRLTPEPSLILACHRSCPEVIYYSHRKGWHCGIESQSAEIVEEYRNLGADYYVTVDLEHFLKDEKFARYMWKNYTLVEFSNNEEQGKYIIFDLRKNGDSAHLLASVKNGNFC